MYMRADAIWSAFAETGDPLCYLLYRAMDAGRRRETDETRGTAAG